MRVLRLAALAALLALCLSGCSVLGFVMTPDWTRDADLIVVNRNETPVCSITVERVAGSETTVNADGAALLEQGESYGLTLDGGEGSLTVVLAGEDGGTLARFPVRFTGTRLVLAYEADGSATIQREGPRPEGTETP